LLPLLFLLSETENGDKQWKSLKALGQPITKLVILTFLSKYWISTKTFNGSAAHVRHSGATWCIHLKHLTTVRQQSSEHRPCMCSRHGMCSLETSCPLLPPYTHMHKHTSRAVNYNVSSSPSTPRQPSHPARLTSNNFNNLPN